MGAIIHKQDENISLIKVGHLFIMINVVRKLKLEAYAKISDSFIAFNKQGCNKFILIDGQSLLFLDFDRKKVTYKNRPPTIDLKQTDRISKYFSCAGVPTLITKSKVFVGLKAPFELKG